MSISLRQQISNLVSQEDGLKDANKYWHQVLPPEWHGPYPRHWCGAFALWALKTILHVPFYWEVQGCLGATHSGFLYRLSQTSDPDLGDIGYFDQPYQHHCVVTAAGQTSDGQDYIISMDGNQGPTPGWVQEQFRMKKKFTAFYSIQPLIDEYESKL